MKSFWEEMFAISQAKIWRLCFIQWELTFENDENGEILREQIFANQQILQICKAEVWSTTHMLHEFEFQYIFKIFCFAIFTVYFI